MEGLVPSGHVNTWCRDLLGGIVVSSIGNDGAVKVDFAAFIVNISNNHIGSVTGIERRGSASSVDSVKTDVASSKTSNGNVGGISNFSELDLLFATTYCC